MCVALREAIALHSVEQSVFFWWGGTAMVLHTQLHRYMSCDKESNETTTPIVVGLYMCNGKFDDGLADTCKLLCTMATLRHINESRYA